MNKLSPSSITIEEAVARMVNIRDIPAGNSLLEFTEFLADKAEEEYEDAKKNGLSSEQLDLLKLRIQACDARHQLASYLERHISWELDTPVGSLLKRSSDSSSIKRLEVQSVSQWASYHYDIGRFDYEELENVAREMPITNAEKEAVKISKKGLSPLLAGRLYIIFAYLLEAFIKAKKNPVGFGTPENPNIIQTSEYLHDCVVEFKGNAKFFDIETLQGRIKIALAMKKLFGKN